MFLLFLLIGLGAFAETGPNYTFEKSFPRDNTFCSYKGKQIELIIRGGSKFTEPNERGYGELIFIRHLPSRDAILLPLNSSRLHTLKLFLGVSPLCSKSHAYEINQNTMALLLHKENKPFFDKLVIQLFEVPSFKPLESLETDYPTDKAVPTNDGFAFRAISENYRPETGKISIENKTFIYQEKNFPQWINYSKKGFEVDQKLTFSKFPWKQSFSSEADFLSNSGWDKLLKKFLKTTLYVAVNYELKKQCLLLLESRKKLSGNESWRCHGL